MISLAEEARGIMLEVCIGSEHEVRQYSPRGDATRPGAPRETGTPEWLLDVRAYWASLTAQPERAVTAEGGKGEGTPWTGASAPA